VVGPSCNAYVPILGLKQARASPSPSVIAGRKCRMSPNLHRHTIQQRTLDTDRGLSCILSVRASPSGRISSSLGDAMTSELKTSVISEPCQMPNTTRPKRTGISLLLSRHAKLSTTRDPIVKQRPHLASKLMKSGPPNVTTGMSAWRAF
jgi:hypothetical protein